MSNEFVLNAEPREDVGKGSSRRLRRQQDKVPAIIYGGKGKQPENITLEHKDLTKALETEAFFSHIITINLGKKSEQVIIKDLQRHPAKPKILHADFLRVSKDVAINVHVPIHFINEDTCIGVKQQGGKVSHNMVEVEITCLPADLPEYLEVDMIAVELDQIVHLSDIKLPKGVEITELSQGADHDQPIAAIHAPKKAEEVDEDTAAPAQEAPKEEKDED